MRYNIFNVALYIRLTMLCCRTEFFATVTEGLSAEVLVKAERLVQREGQAPSPTKSEYDNSNARLYKHTQALTPTKSGCDSSEAKP